MPLKIFNLIYDKADEIRQLFRKEYITPEHTETEHYYRCHIFEGEPLYHSVTQKTRIIGEDHLKKWAADKTVEHIRNNFVRLSTEPEKVFEEAIKFHHDIFKEAGDLGNLVHDAIEDYINEWVRTREQPADIKKFIDEYSDMRVLSAIVAAEKFMKSRIIIPIYSELLVASQKMKVAGTLDFLALVGTQTKPPKDGMVPTEYYLAKTTRGIFAECVTSGHQIRFDLTIIDWKTSNTINKAQYVLQIATYSQALKDTYKLSAKRHIVVRLDKSTGAPEPVELDTKKIRKAITVYRKGINTVFDWLQSPDSQLIKERVIMKLD